MLVFQAGLLTLGSFYSPRLPVRLGPDSGLLRCSSPITAAGPSPNLTGFPIMLNLEHLILMNIFK